MSSARPHAERLLAAGVAALQAAGRPVPGRVFVTPGASSVWDEEQLTVAIPRPSIPGAVAQESARARPVAGPRYCELRLELVRCVPGLTVSAGGEPVIPTAGELQPAAFDLLEDASALSAGITPASVVGEGSPGRPASIGAVTQLGPEGSMAALFLLVSVPL